MAGTQRTPTGFGIVELLLAIVALGVIGTLGWVVYQHGRITGAGMLGTASAPPEQPATADPYAEWKTYSSTLSGFSFRYPTGWDLSGFQGNNPVAADHMTGQETTIRLESKPDTRVDNFGITMYPSAGIYRTPYDTYGNGTTTVLANGITLWQEKAQETYATGLATDTCPAVQVGTDATFAQRLPNGNYLSLYGSFCWGQGLTTAKTYAQQVASPEWAAAIAVVKSIRFY
ncbi:MAG: hypothetical protein OJF49_001061 [Ktedonobacterales bacterium]|jgi:hypothetical protein|nr:MAG: hypothetical protein OJF49_001061 [Ktedonobacterales bacterium]